MLVELELVAWSGFAAHLIVTKKALLSIRAGVGVRRRGSFVGWKRKGEVVAAIDAAEKRSSPGEDGREIWRFEIRFPAIIHCLVQACDF